MVRKKKNQITISKILGQFLTLFIENHPLILKIMVLGFSLSLLSPYLNAKVLADQYLLKNVLYFGVLFLSTWTWIALILAFSHCYQGEEVSVKDCFIGAKGAFWSFSLYTSLYGLLVLAGLLLLVIPGIYLGVIYSLAFVAVVLERRKVSPLKLSVFLIKNHFGVVGVLFALTSLPALWNCYMSLFPPFPVPFSKFYGILVTVLTAPVLSGIYVVLFHLLETEKGAGEKIRRIGGYRISGFAAFLSTLGVTLIFLVLVGLCCMGLRKLNYSPQGWEFFNRLYIKGSHKVIFYNSYQVDPGPKWYVRKKDKDFGKYRLSNYSHKYIPHLSLGVSFKDDYFPSGNVKAFTPKVFRDWIWNATVYQGQAKEDIDEGAIKSLPLGAQTWWNYYLDYKRNGKRGRYEYFFTVVDKDIISVSFAYDPTEFYDGRSPNQHKPTRTKNIKVTPSVDKKAANPLIR